MNMKIQILFVLTAVQLVYGVINTLNESEYARLPPLFRLDNFEGCLRARGDKYCYLHGEILDGDSELHTLIKEYSANTVAHYNHSLIHWGICATQTCRQYFANATLEDALDACINATLYESHQLQARVTKKDLMCTDFGEAEPYDGGDFAVAAVFLTLLMLNFFGTSYDLCFLKTQKGFLGRLLLCFSVRRSWQKLVMPSGEGPDPKLKSLKCLNGIKVLNTILIVMGHTPLISYIAIDNPQVQEEGYHRPLFQFLLNGTLIVQTFFMTSGFLLSYNILVASEKRRIGWRTLPQGILLRWLRLTPFYALVMAFLTTWLRHLNSGPVWKPMVNTEVVDCRRYWWLHLLYVSNYVDHSQCMPQSWYLAGDMQLTVIGLAILCLFHSARARKIAIGVTFVVGLVTPGAHTYFQKLHGLFMATPEMQPRFFADDPSFNVLHKRSHTNLACYAMGLALGMVMYNLHGQELTKHKKICRMLYRAAVPMGAGLVMVGMVFYVDDIQIPLIVRAVYASAIKICFGVVIGGVIAGTLMKLDSVICGILEWKGWAPLGRLSYGVYLIHMIVMRTSTQYYTTLQHNSTYHLCLNVCGFTVVSYMLAVPCWLLVESPIAQFVKLCFEGGSRNKSDITIKVETPNEKAQELSGSVETVVVKTTL